MSNCEFCHKVLSKEKGEEDHGCLDCAGYIYIVNGVNVCFHCIEKENQEMRIKIANHVEWNEGFQRLERENKRLKREIEVLRLYGNKDCTAMADEVLDNE